MTNTVLITIFAKLKCFCSFLALGFDTRVILKGLPMSSSFSGKFVGTSRSTPPLAIRRSEYIRTYVIL